MEDIQEKDIHELEVQTSDIYYLTDAIEAIDDNGASEYDIYILTDANQSVTRFDNKMQIFISHKEKRIYLNLSSVKRK